MARGSPATTGMTFIEVTICIAVLATALVALVGNVYSLSQSHHANRESQVAGAISRLLVERLQGAAWHTLGTSSEPWSWHRPLAGGTPMTENAVDADHNLFDVGVLQRASGLENLEVYLEYRTMDAFTTIGTQDDWQNEVADTSNLLDPSTIDLAEEASAIVFRVVLRWRGRSGGPRQEELFFARRK